MRSARVGTMRVIEGEGRILAYDLAVDPGEESPRILSALEFEALVGRRPPASAGLSSMDVVLEDQAFRSLGYVQ
jgi:hypothetical protein